MILAIDQFWTSWSSFPVLLFVVNAHTVPGHILMSPLLMTQGAQAVGMGIEVESVPAAVALYAKAAEILG